jgi:hypothetical protein
MTATQPETMDRAFEAICVLLMPFFLLGAEDDPEKARGAVADLLNAYDPANVQELDLVARIVGFSAAALDNLRLSITSLTLSDTKVLRYRSTAVSLSRSSEQCRTTLKKIQAERPAQPVAASAPTRLQTPLPPMTAARIEKAKNEARDLLAGLARLGAQSGQGMTAIRIAPDPGAQITAAVTAAFRGDPNPMIAVRPR